MTELQILKELTDKITGILNGKVSTTSIHNIDEGDISSQPDEIKALYERINLLCEKHAEASQFMLQLSKGSLEQDPPKANFLISPFKELHSSLRHMIWQTQRIADGDYNQHINFMGDFSTSFNQLIESLRQKQAAELALQKSEERARLFLENATDVIFVLDLNLNLIYISPACLNIFGYTDEECMQMPLNSLFSESVMLDQKKKMAEYIGQYRQTGVNRIISSEGQIPHRAGQSIWIETTMRILPDKNGEIIGIQGVKAFENVFTALATNGVVVPQPLKESIAKQCHQDFMLEWKRENWKKNFHPLLGVLQTLSVQEMAHLAESLLGLESLKERVTSPSESVGGPIDVAAITKSEGLVWIKRKHYFDASINMRYASRLERSFD